MVKPSTKPYRLTAKQYRDFLKRHSLRQVDGGWLCDKGKRQSSYWVVKGVSGSSALLLKAFDDGIIPLEWFVAHVKRPIP